MKKQLARAKELLAPENLLDGILQARLARIPDSKFVPHVRSQQTQLQAIIDTVEASINRRITRVDDLPKWLSARLDKLIELIECNDEARLEEIYGAFKTIIDDRDLIVVGLVRASAEAITERLTEGYDAVREATDASARAKGSATKAAGHESKAEAAAKQSELISANAATHLSTLAEKVTEAQSSAKTADRAAESAATYRDEAKEFRKSAQKHADHSATMRHAVDEIKENLEELLETESEFFETHRGIRNTLESELSEIQKKARRILFEATTAALAKEWAAKRQNAQWIAGAWCVVLFFFVAVALASSVFIVVPEAFQFMLPEAYLNRLARGDQSFEHSLMTKVFIVPPLIFVIWFAASQYAHTRDRQLEFGKRETLAKTLESYQIYLKSLAPEDEGWQREVLALFKGSIERLYEYLLSAPDLHPKTSFRLFRGKEYTLDDLPELLSKLKGLGINIDGSKGA